MSPLYEFEGFRIEPLRRLLLRGDSPVAVSNKAFDLLLVLLERRDRIVSKDELLEKVWPDTVVEENNLTVAMSGLRKALGESANDRRYILTIPGRGYRFVAEVSLPQEERPAAIREFESPLAEKPEPQAVSEASLSLAPPTPRFRRSTAWIWAFCAIVGVMFLAAVLGWRYWRDRQTALPALPPEPTVLADFDNRTGDAVFDDALRQGLIVGLEQSPALQVVSDRKAGAILAEMGRSPQERVTGDVAIELCQRAGGKVLVQGSISELGTTYVLGLTAIRCADGESIAHEQMQAANKDAIIGVLGKTTAMMRMRLGESPPSIEQYSTPLEQATTGSLDALKVYSIALATADRQGDIAAIPLYQHAIELDPNFAMAYGSIAESLYNQGEVDRARSNASKAFALRDRVTEYERLSIESYYHAYVTGDLEQSANALEVANRIYPQNARTLNDLGAAYSNLGQYDKGAGLLGDALRLDPQSALTRSNLAIDLMGLNRVDEAAAVLAEAEHQKLHTELLVTANYYLAFLRRQMDGMQKALAQERELPDTQSMVASIETDTASYFGHFAEARRLTAAADKQMEHADDRESAAECWAEAALRDAEIGDMDHTRDEAAKALRLMHSDNVMTLTALSLARIGDSDQAQKVAQNLDKDHPADTIIQKYWLPTIRAAIALQQGRPMEAIDLLNITRPVEMALPDALGMSVLYPAYVRGQAYLAAGDGKSAGAEFQKLLDHPGMVLNFPLGALAQLGRARAYAREGDTARARDSYRKFFVLWKGADPEIPMLQSANKEYAALH